MKSLGTGRRFNHMTICENGEGQHVGTLAEMEFSRFLIMSNVQHTWSACDKGPYDFAVMDISGRMVGIDVKAKKRNVPPSHSQDAHVTCDQELYECHVYVFYSVTDDKPTAMGWIGKGDFWRDCRRVRKGDRDGSFEEHVDAGKMKYSELKPMTDLLGYLKSCWE